MAKKVNGKQLLDNTVIKSINGVTYSYQGLTTSTNNNVTLNVVPGQTHSFNLGWTGLLPLNKGGLSNSTFTASQILIVNSATSSVISSGYVFNDSGSSAFDIWSASKILTVSVPSQTGHSGQYLTTNGVTMSWGTVGSQTLIQTLTVGNSSGTYSIDMNQNRIINVATGSSALDAVNVSQLASATASLQTQISSNTTTLSAISASVSSNSASINSLKKAVFGISIDGQGGVITTGSKGVIPALPYSGVINGWSLYDATGGTVSIDIRRGGSSIVGGGNKPTLSGTQRNSANVSGWSSITLAIDDEIEFYVESASYVTCINLLIKVTES